MSHEIHWEKKGVFVELFGKIDHQSFQAVSLELQSHSEFYDCRYIICSLLGMSEMNYNFHDIETRIHFDGALSKSNYSIKNAFVSTHEEALALASFYQSEMEDSSWESQFFTTVEDARAWVEK